MDALRKKLEHKRKRKREKRRVRYVFSSASKAMVLNDYSAMPLPPSEDLIMKLPAELRNEIYELSLLDGHVKFLGKGMGRRQREPALLRASKQIRHEALPLYYKAHSFCVTIGLHQLGSLAQWLEGILSRCGTKLPFKSFDVQINQCEDAWDYRHRLLPLAEFFRKFDAQLVNDIQPQPNGLRRRRQSTSCMIREPMNITKKNCPNLSGPMLNLLEKTMRLGGQARVGQWSAQRLAKRYNEVVATKENTKAYQSFLSEKQLLFTKEKRLLRLERDRLDSKFLKIRADQKAFEKNHPMSVTTTPED